MTRTNAESRALLCLSIALNIPAQQMVDQFSGENLEAFTQVVNGFSEVFRCAQKLWQCSVNVETNLVDLTIAG
ncbi:hypothetical protein FOQG_19025 [Fusarium oxysporum f. sp. raphani 54005]|jgi:hypothetical protein|uniref:Uncharacterized protein n=1 Tax=Fusarium oxysporum f. sp. raphani 54005 TaxID=1089458 RepID=X0BCN0_FUSOX|nr:hypothetical protein FOQG_19025 [Fusarium oxysporum f. sp. raphani 54005]